MRVQQYAYSVIDFIARRDYITPTEVIAEALGLTNAQVHYAVRFGREEQPDRPILSFRGYGGGYLITDNVAWVNQYKKEVIRYSRTSIRRMRVNLTEYALSQLTPDEARTLLGQLDGIVTDLAAVANGNGY